jgi:hypothetical protein
MSEIGELRATVDNIRRDAAVRRFRVARAFARHRAT